MRPAGFRSVATDTEVLVVGGGVAGASLFHALGARGIRTMLIDRGAVGAQGASAIPAALLNPHRGRTGRASALDSAGLSAFWRWARRLESAGLDTGAHRSGVFRVASSPRQRTLWSRLDGPVLMDEVDFPAQLRAKFGGMLVEDGGWVEPRRWLAALLEAARATHTSIAEGVELRSLSGSGTLTATTSRGAITARQVVLCLGTYDASRLRLPRLDSAPGLAVTLGFNVDPAAGLRPVAGSLGIVFTGSDVVVSGAAHSGDAADVERLRSSASWFVPGLAAAPVTSVWRGVKAKRPSGVPVLRQLRSGLTLFGGLGGRGFLCSALLAESLAERLATRSPERQ